MWREKWDIHTPPLLYKYMLYYLFAHDIFIKSWKQEKKSVWQWDCILPREIKIQDQVLITAPLYRGYLVAPQYILGASLRPLVKLLICPTSQRKLAKPSFFCDSHGYNTRSLDSQKQASPCEEICLKWEILQFLLWSLSL